MQFEGNLHHTYTEREVGKEIGRCMTLGLCKYIECTFYDLFIRNKAVYTGGDSWKCFQLQFGVYSNSSNLLFNVD